MNKTYLLSALLLSGALALTGCENKSTKANTETKSTMSSNQKSASNARSYEDAGKTDEDHLWLEEVESEAALTKVKEWNAASAPEMQGATYKAMKKELLEIYNSPEKIPYISYRNGEAHNFWQDDTNVRGLWRKTTLDSYASGDPKWKTILDIDALAKRNKKNWVYKGNDCFAPKNVRCMISLSDGGKDAVERREFNAKTGKFFPKKTAFNLPESKGATDWLDNNTLIVGVDFGEGTMTESGYPRQVRLWKRGTPVEDAKILYEGDPAFVGSWGYTTELLGGKKAIILQNSLTFFERQYFWLPDTEGAAPAEIPIPPKSTLGGRFKGQHLLSLQEDWRGHKSGSLVSFSFADFMEDGKIDKVNPVFMPGERQSINSYGITKDAVLMSISENVAGSAHAFTLKNGKWTSQKLDFPENGTVSIGSTNDKESIAFINTESFLEPDTLWTVDTSDMSITKARSLPSWFDKSTMRVKQFEVASSDGTMIPYFVIFSKNSERDGTNPTLLYGYGGFRISLNPSYSATIGKAWLERGGIYVLANTRGGEEFGPKWHQAGLKEKRQLIYDDFIAVAEDLVARDMTSPEHLGIHGRSNGGLLMGVMFTQRPDLFKAVAIGVPLLDMHRYHKLLAGHSWIGEYGDPDDKGAEGNFIRNLSPYHNIDPKADYPVPYIYTSTKDDRVHPAHARKFAQRLEDYGMPFLYYENIDGGHAGAANLEETAHSQALIYSYFYDALK